LIPLLDLDEQKYRDSPIVKAMAEYEVVIKPDKIKAQWSVGAPSILITESGQFFMAARMREGDSRLGKRGYEIRIFQSNDGIHFQPIHHIFREDVRAISFGRPALLRDPKTGKFKLYGCTKNHFGWHIFKFDDCTSPDEFESGTIHPVLKTDRVHLDYIEVRGYKDPVIYWDGKMWHMYVVGIDAVERVHHFKSFDSETWEHIEPLIFIDNNGWHNYSTRPSAILPLPVGFLFAYEGAHHTWNDPAYNIATGLAYSPDLMTTMDLTPDYPLLLSTTPGEYFSWRNSAWQIFNDKLYVYFEAALPYNSNEIRLSILDLPLTI
jgi:hypothetical protein